MPPPGPQPDRERNKTEIVDEIATAVSALRSQGIVRANNLASVLAASQIIVKAERLRELFEEYVGHPVDWTELAQIYEDTWGFVDRKGRTQVRDVLNRGPKAGKGDTPTEGSGTSPHRPTSPRDPMDSRDFGLEGLGL